MCSEITDYIVWVDGLPEDAYGTNSYLCALRTEFWWQTCEFARLFCGQMPRRVCLIANAREIIPDGIKSVEQLARWWQLYLQEIKAAQ